MHVPMPLPTRGSLGGRSNTWAKLWALAVVFNLGGFLVAFWVARLVRQGPESASVETALMFGYYAALCAVAFVDALLFDELFFRGSFRRTHLQGMGNKLVKRDEDVDEVVVTMQRSTFSFPVLALLCGGLTYLGFNGVNGDFNLYYRLAGQHINTLEHGSGPKKVEAIKTLSIRREPEVLPALIATLEREEGEPARWGAWALGRFSDVLRDGKLTVRPLAIPLVAASRSEDRALAREALISLGRLQYRTAAPQIIEELERMAASDEGIDLRLFYALGSVQVMDAVPVLERLLHRGTPEVQRLAAWALAQHRDQRGGRAVVDILEQRLATAPIEVRCAVVHALGILADERSNLALMRAYDHATPRERQTTCARIQLSLQPDGAPDDRADLLMPQDVFAMKVITSMGQMRATSPELRAEVEPWLVDLVNEADTPVGAREAGRSLLEGIRSGRDDTKKKSIDEALKLVK